MKVIPNTRAAAYDLRLRAGYTAHQGVAEGIKAAWCLPTAKYLTLIKSRKTIVGGGVIGLEMASYFNSADSRVTVIEMLPHIAGQTDREISSILLKNYTDKGVEFKLGCKVVEVTDSAVVYESEGKTYSVPADKVLLSIGRKPCTKDIGLESIGCIASGGNRNGQYHADKHTQRLCRGRLNGKSMLAHTAFAKRGCDK